MMKKAMMALVAAVMMSANMVAQTEEQAQAPQQPMQDMTEVIKQRTEQMVKEYELTEEQAGMLLALNTEYAEKMPMMMMGPGMRDGQRGPRGGEMRRPMRGPRAENGEARQQMPDSMRQVRPMRPMGDRPGFGGREDMRKVMEDYNLGLKKIFTEDQFKKYEESMNARRQQMRRGGPRGMMGRRPDPQQQTPAQE